MVSQKTKRSDMGSLGCVSTQP